MPEFYIKTYDPVLKKEVTHFSANQTIEARLYGKGLKIGKYPAVIVWINPKNKIEASNQIAFQIFQESDEDVICWKSYFEIIKKRWPPFQAVKEEYFGKWTVIVKINDRIVAEGTFYFSG